MCPFFFIIYIQHEGKQTYESMRGGLTIRGGVQDTVVGGCFVCGRAILQSFEEGFLDPARTRSGEGGGLGSLTTSSAKVK